jgi:hypothetical protein
MAPPGGGPCGLWAMVVTAKTAVVSKPTAAMGRNGEDDFKPVSSRGEVGASLRWTEF